MREGEHLAKCGSYDKNDAAQCRCNGNDCHNCGLSLGVRGPAKDLIVSSSCRAIEGVIDVTNAKANGQDYDEAGDTVEQDWAYRSQEKYQRRISAILCFHGVSNYSLLGCGSEDSHIYTAE